MDNTIRNSYVEPPSKLVALLLDDDNVDARYFKRLLDQLKYYNVELVHTKTTSEAVAQLKSRDFNIFFIDFWLGDKTSLDFIDHVGGRIEGVPMVLITSLSTPSVRKQALAAGAASVLYKDNLSLKEIETAIEVSFQVAGESDRFSASAKGPLSDIVTDSEDYALLAASELENGIEALEALVDQRGEASSNGSGSLAAAIADMREALSANIIAYMNRTGKAQSSKGSINVPDVVNDTIQTWRDQAQKAGVRSHPFMMDIGPAISLDSGLFSVMISHLYRYVLASSNSGATISWDCNLYKNTMTLSILSSDAVHQGDVILNRQNQVEGEGVKSRSLMISEFLAKRLGGGLTVKGGGDTLTLSVTVENQGS